MRTKIPYDVCQICMDRAVNHVIVLCGHCFCLDCLANQVTKTVPTSAGGFFRKAECASCFTAFWLKDKSNLVLGGKAARTQAAHKEAHESLSINGQVVSGVRQLYLPLG